MLVCIVAAQQRSLAILELEIFACCFGKFGFQVPTNSYVRRKMPWPKIGVRTLPLFESLHGTNAFVVG